MCNKLSISTAVIRHDQENTAFGGERETFKSCAREEKSGSAYFNIKALPPLPFLDEKMPQGRN